MRTWVNIGIFLFALSLTLTMFHLSGSVIDKLEEENNVLKYEVSVLENRIEVYRTTWDYVLWNAKTIQSIGECDALAEFVLKISIPRYPLKTVPPMVKE